MELQHFYFLAFLGSAILSELYRMQDKKIVSTIWLALAVWNGVWAFLQTLAN